MSLKKINKPVVLGEELVTDTGKYALTWLPISENQIRAYSPITQAYGICLDSENRVAIVRDGSKESWTLPGGTVEEEESILDTLRREVGEEADLEVNKIRLLGLQRVTTGARTYFQARFICRIKIILLQSPDPSKGRILKRKFVKVGSLNKFLRWGRIGDELVRLTEEYISKKV